MSGGIIKTVLSSYFLQKVAQCNILLPVNLPVVSSPLQLQSGAEQTLSMTGLKRKQTNKKECLCQHYILRPDESIIWI